MSQLFVSSSGPGESNDPEQPDSSSSAPPPEQAAALAPEAATASLNPHPAEERPTYVTAQWPAHQAWPAAQWPEPQAWPRAAWGQPDQPRQQATWQQATWLAPAPPQWVEPAALPPRIAVGTQATMVHDEAATQALVAVAAPAAAVAATTAAVWEAARPKQAPVWRAVKWPIRNSLKGIYLAGSAAKRHRAISAVLLLLLLALIGSGALIYGLTHPAPLPPTNPQAVGPAQDETPFTIISPAAPQLAPGVVKWLYAYKTYDGKELWSSMSPDLQATFMAQNVTLGEIQKSLDQYKDKGISFQEFIYSGGGAIGNGYSHYTVDVLTMQDGQQGLSTWYFVADPNGKVYSFKNVSVPLR